METFIREDLIKKHHLMAAFFNLQKAYDTTWRYGIMKDLNDLGLRARLPLLIQNFLSHRNFRSTLSDFQNQEGIPQGSILSITLFSIKINTIIKCFNPAIDSVDSFVICHKSTNMCTTERQLQLNLNKINKWQQWFQIFKNKD